jgi:outer membrane protein
LTMNRYIILYILLLIIPGRINSQTDILTSYINKGLESNLALRQKQSGYEKSMAALKEARSWYYPDISINARYSRAEGGRVIEFPVGDMMNPVYSTLNMLIGSNQFPLIDNMEFYFLRETEHETKVSVIQPIIDPKIYYNNKINKHLSQAVQADADAYKRQLVAEIKTAYYNYLKVLQLEQLVNDTRTLLEENVRVNESLYRNDKVTIDNVYRSKAELSKLEQQAAEILKSKQVARSWFNFLLNKPHESEIAIAELPELSDSSFIPADLPTAQNKALNSREEITMLENYSLANDYLISLNQSQKLPTLYGAVDYGFQGTEYQFNSDYDYMLASVVLRWNLWHGFEKKAKLSQARIERDIRQDQLEESRNQIRLQVEQAYYKLKASQASIIAARQECNSARQAFGVINRKFKEGQASLIEFIDARTAMTNSENSLIISQYDYLIKFAEFERAACLYDF